MSRVRRCWLLLLLAALSLIAVPPAPTSSHPAALDLIAYPALEVTQGVQTYKPSGNVPMVANRRTFVFFYARTNGNTATATAKLKVTKGNSSITLNPLNSNGRVTMNGILPNRYTGERQFRFELPSGYRTGTVSLEATLNPGHNPVETDYGNNTGQKTVTFESVPSFRMYMFDVRYKVFGDGSYVYSLDQLAPTSHRGMMIDWLHNHYPIANGSIPWHKRAIYMGKKHRQNDGDLVMWCTSVNISVGWWLLHNRQSYTDIAYGMAPDHGGYMRGCAEVAGDHNASGPTGSDSRGWDYDGSYGDWYGGHELGHILGRAHVDVCDAPVPKNYYPYAGGRISPIGDGWVNLAQEYGPAVVGFNPTTSMTKPKFYTSDYHDVMTYCSKRVMSDYSYKVIKDYLQANYKTNKVVTSGPVMDRYLVAGAIDALTGQAQVEPIHVLPQVPASDSHQDGDHAIVLRDAQGGELLRYPFMPAEPFPIEPSSYREGRDNPPPAEQLTQPRTFFELVPFTAGTARIDIEGPGGVLLYSAQAGPTAPTLTITAPAPGGRIPASQSELEVTWSASDPDGDELSYTVEYSPDQGGHWEPYAYGITETEVLLPQENLGAGSGGLLRISASDGVHTTVQTLATPLLVENHPPTIEFASTDVTSATVQIAARGQTVTIDAEAYDIDDGPKSADIVWSSNLQGVVATGPTLSHADLLTGTHILTAAVTDTHGISAEIQTQVMIVGQLEDLPATPDQLTASVDSVYFSTLEDSMQAVITISNLNPDVPITWQASADQPWILLDATSGTTTEQLTVSLDLDAVFDDGIFSGELLLTSPQAPGSPIHLPVTADIVLYRTLMPLLRR